MALPTTAANDRAVRDAEADAASEEFAVAGMGLQEPTTAAAEGSGGQSMVPGDAAPPAHGALGDATPQPAAVDPSSSEGAEGESEPAAAVLTLEQRGAAIRAAFKEHARDKKWLAEGDAVQPAVPVPCAGAEPARAGGQARTGLGVGAGVFDATYTPDENALPLTRYGKGYAKESDWTPAVAQDWEQRLEGLRAEWAGGGVTVRLFKVRLVGQGAEQGGYCQCSETGVGAHWGSFRQHGGILRAVRQHGCPGEWW